MAKRKESENFMADFFPALDALEKERKISKEVMLEALKAGIASAYRNTASQEISSSE